MPRKTNGTRSRKTKAAKGANAAPANPGRRYELLGLACVAAGLISLGGLFELNVGYVGLYFAKFLHYFFGVGAVLVCVLILLMGYQYITKHCGLRYSLRFIGLGWLYISVLAIWHHFVIPVGEEILPSSLPEGGGLLGGGLLLVLRNFFGVDGAIILLIAGIIGSVLLSTTWSLATGVLKTKETAVKGASVAGTALAATTSKMAEVGGRVEERMVEAVKTTVKNSFYNQEKDGRFAETVEEAPAVARQLKELGFDNIVMMTGDSKHTAKAIAGRVGVDRFYAEVLPEEKAHFVLSEKAKGNTVVMIGDGVNDSPALSSADVGIAISNGAAIAREIADITISENDLGSILTLRKLSTAMMKRIGRNYRSILSVNGGLIALGVGGLAQPTTTAMLHNASTLGIGLLSTKKLI